MKKKIFNLVIFQLGWAVCVLGGNLLAVSYTLIALLIHQCYLVENKSEWKLIGLVALVGISWDSLLVFSGFILYPDAVWLVLPVWMLCLWLLFATTFLHSLNWLAGYLYLAAGMAAIFGPMSYWAGVEFSDASFGDSINTSLIVIGIGWIILFPLGIFMTGRFKQ